MNSRVKQSPSLPFPGSYIQNKLELSLRVLYNYAFNRLSFHHSAVSFRPCHPVRYLKIQGSYLYSESTWFQYRQRQGVPYLKILVEYSSMQF